MTDQEYPRLTALDHQLRTNQFLLAGVISPGVVEWSGADREYPWDVKDAKGSDGATATAKGKKLAEFTGKLTIWLDSDGTDHFDKWYYEFLPVLKASAEASPPQALDIYHPELVRNDIRSVVVTKVGQLTHEGSDIWSVEIGFLEHKEPTPGGGTPSGSNTSSRVNNGTPPPPDTPEEEEKLGGSGQLFDDGDGGMIYIPEDSPEWGYDETTDLLEE